MGFLSGLRKKPPVVDSPPAAITTANDQDPESEAIDHAEAMRIANLHFVDPAIERRVVRKLDLKLIPLVMGLCK